MCYRDLRDSCLSVDRKVEYIVCVYMGSWENQFSYSPFSLAPPQHLNHSRHLEENTTHPVILS